MSFQKLDTLCHQLDALSHALSILSVDEATAMAPGGGEARANSMASLAGMLHRQSTEPQIRDWIEAAKLEDLDEERQAAIVELERQYINATCLPAEFVEEQTRARMACEQLWRVARGKGDWKGFAPSLDRVLNLVREEAAMRSAALGLAPYDALMEQYDPGNRVADIAPIFDDLKSFLVDFVPVALATQDERLRKNPLKQLSGNYPVENQRALGLAMMDAVGFDENHGSLSVSHHPFCGGVPSDVRITTRYRTDEFLSALMGILHETGHALYEQNLPKKWAHWPLGKARGMAVHESQSLFVEKQLGRNPAFWTWALPKISEYLGETWSSDEILPHVHHVERGLIRVDADEVTYPLHVILRFEIEQQLVDGSLATQDIPEAWDARMQSYLGLKTLDDPANGPMQDVHWPSGAIGYFPSYTLGAMMAAQQWASIEKSIPSVQADIAQGRFDGVNEWRNQAIWSQGSRWSTPELLRRATGETLNVNYFKFHLQKRYGANA